MRDGLKQLLLSLGILLVFVGTIAGVRAKNIYQREIEEEVQAQILRGNGKNYSLVSFDKRTNEMQKDAFQTAGMKYTAEIAGNYGCRRC